MGWNSCAQLVQPLTIDSSQKIEKFGLVPIHISKDLNAKLERDHLFKVQSGNITVCNIASKLTHTKM